MNTKRKKTSKRDWLIVTGLILLSLIPMVAGAFRMMELSSGAEVTPENARFFASPLPVVIHIISSVLFSILGAFQFPRGIRHRWPRWHRKIGWLLAPAGIASALSGLWMTQFYPWPQYDGELLYAMRLLFGTVMLLCLIFGITAVRQRNFNRHGEWMIRGYAIGLGAGTQVLTHLPWFLFPSVQGETSRAIAMGAGWMINIIIAEWIIRRQRASRAQSRRPVSASL